MPPSARAFVEILMVEDNPADVLLMREVLRGAKIRNHLHTVSDGVEAMAFLRRLNGFAGAVRPQLLLLDLNLPRKTGFEVLEEMKKDPDLRHIPVVVITTSQADQDVLQAYRLQASAFVTKSVDFDQFVASVRALEEFWLAAARLPSA